MSEINAPFNKKSEPDIVIIAHQWWWDIRYPKYDVITANELHIPVGKKLLMRVESADVIHDWWVPKLGRKIDAVPGQLNYNWIEADTAGVYTGTCSEYCGMEHAWMRIMVVAQDKNHFNNWIKNQQKIPEVPVNKPSRTGAILFQKKTCANCHSINGTPADSHIGPDLTHLGSRATLLSGMLKNNRVNLSRWLKNPQKVKEGAHMPNFILSKYEINALVSYLEGLK
jgi:cytochrome c oxidase subunit 2